MSDKNYKNQLLWSYVTHILDYQFTKLLFVIDIFGLIFILFPSVQLTPMLLLIINVSILIIIALKIFIGKEYDYISKPLHTFYEHTYHINAIAVDSERKYLASCSGDESTIIWDLQTNNVLHRLPSEGWVGNIRFAKKSDILVILNGKHGTLSLFDTKSDKLTKIDCEPLGQSRGLAINNNMIYVSSKTGLVSRIDISDSSPVIEKTQVSTKEIRKMAISNYGYFACGDSNGELFMCDNPRLENIKSFYKIPESEIIRDVVFNPDGSCVGFTDSGGHLSILDIETKSIITKKAHNGHAICLSFSPNGNIVATGGQDEVIRLWRINEGKIEGLFEIKGHSDDITDLEFDSDSILWSASRDAKIKNWDLRGIDMV